jgi:hypothetical protein
VAIENKVLLNVATDKELKLVLKMLRLASPK